MVTPKEMAEFDQAASLLADMLPPAWWRMRERLLEVGFDKQEALTLLATYISASFQPSAKR